MLSGTPPQLLITRRYTVKLTPTISGLLRSCYRTTTLTCLSIRAHSRITVPGIGCVPTVAVSKCAIRISACFTSATGNRLLTCTIDQFPENYVVNEALPGYFSHMTLIRVTPLPTSRLLPLHLDARLAPR